MRSVLPTLFLAAAVASPAAAEPFITPGVVAGTVIPALISTAVEAGITRAQYAPAPGPYGYSPSGTYVQFYDPRTGMPVGGPVPVSPEEFARRAASVPADAPVIGLRSVPTVTDLGIEPVVHRRPVVRPRLRGAHPHLYSPRYGAPIYAGPRRFAPAPFRYGRSVRGYRVVRVPRGSFGPRVRPVGRTHAGR